MIGRSARIGAMFLICSLIRDRDSCPMSYEEVKHGR
jgi:hypothetical protein